MPVGFPSDFPFYPGARLTKAGKVVYKASSSWLMEWQTYDPFGGVETYFVRTLDAGDWVLIQFPGSVDNQFAAEFKRASTAKVTGSMGVVVRDGVTKISVELTTRS
jgi:hypothetical protein